MRLMKAAPVEWILLLVLIAAVGGCTEPSAVNNGMTRNGSDRPAKVAVGVARLSQDIGLQIVEQSRYHATLKNSSNIVMIYPDPDGQVFVNGQPVGKSGGVFVEEGEIFVPSRLESQIRQALRSGMAPVIAKPVRAPHVTIHDRTGRVISGRVVIDPGHGGKDPGAIGAGGVQEKYVVLDVGTRLCRDLSRSGVEVAMTRSDDTFIDLDNRNSYANQIRADLFISVHADSAKRTTARGYTIYVPSGASAKALAAAHAIDRSLVAAGFTSNGVKVHQKNLRVLVNSTVPAVLVELGYLSNVSEASALNDNNQRSVYAGAISEGIIRFLRSK